MDSLPSKKRPPFRLLLKRWLRILTPDGFAIAPLWAQLGIIIVASAILIFAFWPLVGSIPQSYSFFVDPGTYVAADGAEQLFFGFFQIVIGLILMSLIISVITAALEELIEHIRGGTRPYRKSGHILIIQNNAKVPLILDEMNIKYSRLNCLLDIVILLHTCEMVEEFLDELHPGNWPYLNIFVRQGDLLEFETYARVSIHAAAGIILLTDETQPSPEAADTHNLKILATLTNDANFRTHLQRCHQQQHPIKCAIETLDTSKSREIAQSLTAFESDFLFSVITTNKVVNTVLSRAIIDFAYYDIYLELFSFGGHSVYFVNPGRFAVKGLRVGLTFEELCLRFTQGILIGYSHASPAGLDIRLAPFGQSLREGDWLLFIATSETAVTYQDAPDTPPEGQAKVTIPAASLGCRLCIIGAEHTFDRLGDFLDQASRECLAQNQVVRADLPAYLDPEFIQSIRAGGFDRVILNLDDDATFRLYLYVRTLLGPEDPFVKKIITVIHAPLTESLIDRGDGHRHTILADRIAAKYFAQISFQKNLEKVYEQLTSREHAQIKMLDVEVDIPRSALTTKHDIKQLLLAHGLVYVGTVNAQQESSFDANDFTNAAQIIVVCKQIAKITRSAFLTHK